MVTKKGRKPFQKQCKRCNAFKDYRQFAKDGRGSRKNTCRSCASEQSLQSTHELKHAAIEYLGGRCNRCGLSSDILDVFAFHHINPTTKLDTISNLINNRTSFNILRHELDKCALLCLNCHAIVHHEARRVSCS